MYSSKVILVQLVVVVCLAGLILPASANIVQTREDVELEPQGGMFCDVCQQIAAQLKTQLPAAKAQLIELCKNCGSPDNVKKCEQAINDALQQLDTKTPREICQQIGMCTKAGFFKTAFGKFFTKGQIRY